MVSETGVVSRERTRVGGKRNYHSGTRRGPRWGEDKGRPFKNRRTQQEPWESTCALPEALRELKGQEKVGARVSFPRLASLMLSLKGAAGRASSASPGNLLESQAQPQQSGF